MSNVRSRNNSGINFVVQQQDAGKNINMIFTKIGKFLLPIFDVRAWFGAVHPRRRRLSCARFTVASTFLAISLYLMLIAVWQQFYYYYDFPQSAQKINKLFDFRSGAVNKNQSSSISIEQQISSLQHQARNCTEEEGEDGELCIFQRQILSDDDRQLMALTLQKCSQVLNRLHGMAYVLYGTSLLGYYRHNASLIPWEDFVNIALFPIDQKLTNVSSIVRQFHRLVKTLLGNDYSIRFDKKQRIIKCYGTKPSNSRRIHADSPSVFWRWPYVEIQIMNVTRRESQSGAKISTITDPIWADFSFPAEIILPVRPAVFEGASVFVPNDPLIALERNYNPYTCRSIYYSHRDERALDSKLVAIRPCVDLRHFVNFTNLDFFVDINTGAPSCELGLTRDDPLLCPFLPLLNPTEKANVLKLMSICLKMLEKLEDASYFLYGGTLIGHWRHNGSMIPWDDDVDIAVVRTNPDRDEDFYVEQFSRMIGEYPDYAIYYIKDQSKVKCFGTTSSNSRKIGHGEDYEWRWPFVDIQLMKTDFEGGKIANISDTSGFDSFWYPGELIFPLQRAVFESMPAWVPANPSAVLERNYDIRECTAPYYNHRFERVIADERQVSRPCIQLTSMYNFTNIGDDYYDTT